LRGSFVLVGYSGSKLPGLVPELIERSEAIGDATSDTSSYIAGIEVEAFQKSERDTFEERAKGRVDKIVEDDVKNKSQGDRQRDWNWSATYQKEATSVLMPVCHVVFEYSQRFYDFWSDGANILRFVADPLPEDKGRKSAVAISFVPFGVAATLAVICCAVLANDQATPPEIYWGIGLAAVAGLTFGLIRRWALIDYSRRVREAVLNFQKASSTSVILLSDEEKGALLTSFEKPTRSWITSGKPVVILIPTLLAAIAIAVLASIPYWYPPSSSTTIATVEPSGVAPSPSSGMPYQPGPIPAVPPPSEPGASSNPGLVCRDALNTSATDWDTRPRYQAAVAEAKRRGYSVSDCRQTLGLSVPPSSLGDNIPLQLRRRTLDFIGDWYGIVSGQNNNMLAASSSIYAERVDYFGKSLSREEVLAELQRFVDRWPNRSYKARQDTIEVDCDELSMTCNTGGLLDFDSRSPARNERSWGQATFQYVLKFESPTAAPKIIKEVGEVKERHLEPLSSSPLGPISPPGYSPPRASAPQTLCDDLAGNPTDQNKLSTVPGAPYDNLRPQAARAIEACEASAAQYPSELRFQYQLARALAFTDRRRALEILQRIANAGYPASFDNLGWLYYSDLNNPAQAVQYFLQGVRLGDSDAMISLAEMIGRGHFLVSNPLQARIALYKKAAELGNATAARALEIEIAKSQQRLSEAEQQRMMVELFRQFMSNLPRH